jgi:hypothetical protein
MAASLPFIEGYLSLILPSPTMYLSTKAGDDPVA